MTMKLTKKYLKPQLSYLRQSGVFSNIILGNFQNFVLKVAWENPVLVLIKGLADVYLAVGFSIPDLQQ